MKGTLLNNFSKASLAMEGWSKPSATWAWPRFGAGPRKFSRSSVWFGVTALAVLVAVFAIQRVPSAERIVVEKPTLQDRLDAVEPMKKQDRAVIRAVPIVRAEPTPVKTERIALETPPPAPATVVPPPVIMPPVIPQEDDPPPVRTRRQRIASAAPTRGGDVCTRHHMRKVVTRGGKSWRCRR
jgi:hypothetical protein